MANPVPSPMRVCPHGALGYIFKVEASGIRQTIHHRISWQGRVLHAPPRRYRSPHCRHSARIPVARLSSHRINLRALVSASTGGRLRFLGLAAHIFARLGLAGCLCSSCRRHCSLEAILWTAAFMLEACHHQVQKRCYSSDSGRQQPHSRHHLTICERPQESTRDKWRPRHFIDAMPTENVLCVVKIFLVVTLRSGQGGPGASLTQPLASAARRPDGTIQWLTPELPSHF